jgi:hypothetical protein
MKRFFREPSAGSFEKIATRLSIPGRESWPGITNETTHRECVDWIVAWDRKDPLAVGHHDVFTLARNPEARLFEGAHRIEVIDARDLRQRLHRDLDFSNFFALELLFNCG